MHRTHLGGVCAVAAPLAVGVHPVLAAPFVIGVAWARCITAWLALTAAGLLLMPGLWYAHLLLLVVAIAMRHAWPPGAITDTLRGRLLSWWFLARRLSWAGHGRGSARLALEEAHIRSAGRAMDGAPARNELLHLLYERGWLGALVLAACAACAVPWMRWGDPLGAAWIAAAMVCAGTAPLRALGQWLRKGQDGPLWGPPLRASLTVHVDAEGQVHLYGARGDADTRERQREMVRALFVAAAALMDQHGITLDEVEHGRDEARA